MATVTPLTGTLGAQVDGIDMSADLEPSVIDWIAAALVEHKVLFFRDQKLDRQQHLAFGKRFGPLEVHPFAYGNSMFGNDGSSPELLVIESKPGTPISGTDIWHSDVSFREEPALGSILRCIVPATPGGDTLWADMEKAYELLDEETKGRIEGLEAEHDWPNFRAGMRKRGVDENVIADFEKKYPVTRHPVVRTHPVSGRKCIYVNRIFTKQIVGLDKEQSDALLEKLYRQASIPEVQVRFRWEPGSVAFWDNRSTQHYAVSDYGDRHRLMERVTIAGDRPF
jgi:taurine dioxygenase